MNNMSPFPLGGMLIVESAESRGPVGMVDLWPPVSMRVELENDILMESYFPEVTLDDRTRPGISWFGAVTRSMFGPIVFWLMFIQPLVCGRPAAWSWTLVKVA